jgi:hypothetical protein
VYYRAADREDTIQRFHERSRVIDVGKCLRECMDARAGELRDLRRGSAVVVVLQAHELDTRDAQHAREIGGRETPQRPPRLQHAAAPGDTDHATPGACIELLSPCRCARFVGDEISGMARECGERGAEESRQAACVNLPRDVARGR